MNLEETSKMATLDLSVVVPLYNEDESVDLKADCYSAGERHAMALTSKCAAESSHNRRTPKCSTRMPNRL